MRMDNYHDLGRIGEGAHGIVMKARQKETGTIVALKKVSLRRLDDGIPNQALREILALQHLNHENIIPMREVFPHSSGFVLVCDYMLTDLGELIKDFEHPLTIPETKAYLQQLLYGLAYMHSNGIMHRDLKPANLLINENGVLKIADMGLARLFYDDNSRPYSSQVATRWYRAPELLYGARNYDQGVDLWAVGCILGEMLNHSPLFPGENDIEQLVCVFRLLGTPKENEWPQMTSLPDYAKITFPEYPNVEFTRILPQAESEAVDLTSKFLVYDWKQRISAQEALCHDYLMCEPGPCTSDQLRRPKEKTQKSSINVDFDFNKPLSQCLVAPWPK